jgi:hypothetical protein
LIISNKTFNSAAKVDPVDVGWHGQIGLFIIKVVVEVMFLSFRLVVFDRMALSQGKKLLTFLIDCLLGCILNLNPAILIKIHLLLLKALSDPDLVS